MRARVAFFALGVALCASCRRAEPAPAPGDGLVSDKALVDGYLVEVAHSKWDGGRTADLFDEDPGTLARTENANPAIVEIRLRHPRPFRGISVTTGGMDAGLAVTLRPQGGGAVRTFRGEFTKLPPDPTFGLEFDTGETPIESVRVEIRDLSGGDGHLHLRTIKLR